MNSFPGHSCKVVKTMKNILKRLVFVLGIISIIPWGYLYYYYPREVKYESVFEINKPDSSFDRSFFIGFDYVNNKEWLFFFLIDRPVRDHPFQKAYDNAYIEYLSNMMDFDRYDYIITYQKELIRLQYSPYLRRINDDLYFDKRMPLIPTWNTDKTDKIYIYRIKKNKRFRAPGP